jgi:hypothetical protein
MKLDPAEGPLLTALGVLGMPGLSDDPARRA